MKGLNVRRSEGPILLAFPHGGVELFDYEPEFRSRWWAVRDADWHIRALYQGLCDATLVWTEASRSVVDCNRDPSGRSLYPGLATTGLCPTETFDGEPIYREGRLPDVDERRSRFFKPYHDALEGEIARLKRRHERLVLYDCHSIRSRIPRLFEGELPELNLGTDGGRTCGPALSGRILKASLDTGRATVLDGRFRGGWTVRRYGRPETGVHAIQMEIAMRAYLDEPAGDPDEGNWPPAWRPSRAAALRADLARVLDAALEFTKEGA